MVVVDHAFLINIELLLDGLRSRYADHVRVILIIALLRHRAFGLEGCVGGVLGIFSFQGAAIDPYVWHSRAIPALYSFHA